MMIVFINVSTRIVHWGRRVYFNTLLFCHKLYTNVVFNWFYCINTYVYTSVWLEISDMSIKHRSPAPTCATDNRLKREKFNKKSHTYFQFGKSCKCKSNNASFCNAHLIFASIYIYFIYVFVKLANWIVL